MLFTQKLNKQELFTIQEVARFIYHRQKNFSIASKNREDLSLLMHCLIKEELKHKENNVYELNLQLRKNEKYLNDLIESRYNIKGLSDREQNPIYTFHAYLIPNLSFLLYTFTLRDTVFTDYILNGIENNSFTLFDNINKKPYLLS